MNIETKEGLFALMEQIAEEREAARPIVERLVTSGEPLEDIEIPEGWRTAGMVLELCERAYSKNESAPKLSLGLGHLALILSAELNLTSSDSRLSAYFTGRAWREIALGHRYLCTYPAAEQAFVKAESAFSSQPFLHYARVYSMFSRAAIYLLDWHNDKSLKLAAEVRDLFLELKDSRGLVMCDMLDGSIAAFRLGQLDEGRKKLESALERLKDLDEIELTGLACLNLGSLYRLLGRKKDAIATSQRAQEIFIRLGQPSEINRTEWNLATIQLEDGDFQAALDRYKPIRNDYLQRAMLEEAAEAGLCMMDALIALARLEEARALGWQVLGEFSEVQMSRKAITALAYLKDIMHGSNNLQPAVRRVRRYLERLRFEPARLFPTDDN